MNEPFDLRRLHISKPCPMSWAAMTGDARVRFCKQCRLNVYNTSELTAPELRALVTRTEGRVCATLYRRADGTVLTRDCPVGLRKARMKLAAALTAVVALVIAFVGSLRTQERDAALFIDDAPSSGAAALWLKVRVRAERVEDKARTLPVVGPIIEAIDPAPVRMVRGEMIMLPPSMTSPATSSEL